MTNVCFNIISKSADAEGNMPRKHYRQDFATALAGDLEKETGI